MQYNKLVRDNVPGLIMSEGHSVNAKIVDPSDIPAELRDKLREEVNEFCNSDEVEELADILEVIYTIAGRAGKSSQELEEMRLAKREEKGGFDRYLFLIETSEDLAS